jgi:hypothetical protein
MLSFSCGSGASVWQNKNPTAGWQWGSINLVTQSEPNRHAAQQQRVQQQIQIRITVHVQEDTTGLPSRQMFLRHPINAA